MKLVERTQWSNNSNLNIESIRTPDSISVSTSSTISSQSSSTTSISDERMKPVRHLFLVRHGQYQRRRTHSDGHLTEIGERQANYAAHFLSSQLPENVLFDSLTHSDMIRTRETASIIYKQLKSLNKIDIGYFSIDTDFREHNLLLTFLVEGNWRALKRDYFRLTRQSKRTGQTTFEIVVAHRNIIGHCIELLTMIRPDKSIAFNASVTHIVVDERGPTIDYAYKHDFIPIDLLTMWEIFLPFGQQASREPEHVHFDVHGVKGTRRKGCFVRFLISCIR